LKGEAPIYYLLLFPSFPSAGPSSSLTWLQFRSFAPFEATTYSICLFPSLSLRTFFFTPTNMQYTLVLAALASLAVAQTSSTTTAAAAAGATCAAQT
jgi:hypothetical protein